MTDQERPRWTKLGGDYETNELTQRQWASERGVSFSNLRTGAIGRAESLPRSSRIWRRRLVNPGRGSAAGGSRLLPVRVGSVRAEVADHWSRRGR